MKKSYLFAIIVAMYIIVIATGCASQREGCPASHSNGIMRSKFRA